MGRFRWLDHIDEIRAMAADGKTGAEIARRFGLELSACYNGLKRYGVEIDPDATNAARTASCIKMAADPEIRKRRARAQREWMRAPERRETARQMMLARHRADPMLRFKTGDASRTPEANAKRAERMKRVWAARQAWLPPRFRDEYNRLLHGKGMRLAEIRAVLQPEIDAWCRTFEGQLWKLSTGKARLVEKVKLARPVTYVSGQGAMS